MSAFHQDSIASTKTVHTVSPSFVRSQNSVGVVQTHYAHFDFPLVLESGEQLEQFTLAYEIYGRLNADRSNVILICHALSGDAHVAGYHTPQPDEKPGWWDDAVGIGKMFDTDRYCVICSNVIGGCKGSTGPSSIAPDGKPYGLRFPIITIGDMVRAQRHLIDRLQIDRLFAVTGGSMGGMQALQWAIDYPDKVENVLFLASTHRSSAQNIAFNEVGRRAILADPNWKNGNYYNDSPPTAGLAVARMIGHLTYMCEESLDQKFGRTRQRNIDLGRKFLPEFSVENYLDYQGQKFVERFDANSYLYLTKALDYFDLGKRYGSLTETFRFARSAFLVVSFSSDWLYPADQSLELVEVLKSLGHDVEYHYAQSFFGHDSFLLEIELMTNLVGGHLDKMQKKLSKSV